MKKLVGLLSLSFFFIITLGVLLFFSFNLKFYKEHLDQSQMTNERVVSVNNVYRFLQNKELLGPDFTQLESDHLQDVKKIFFFVYYVFFVSIALFLSIILLFIFGKKCNLIFEGLFIGSILVSGLFLLLIIVVLIDFDLSFNFFHKLFFPQGNWSFPSDSKLITLFPVSFFILISQKMFTTIFFFSISTLLISMFLKDELYLHAFKARFRINK